MVASKSFFDSCSASLEVFVPLDPNRTGTVARRAERATRYLWSRGIYPTPSAVNLRMRGRTRDCLNGIETKARNAVLEELKIPMLRKWNGSTSREGRNA